MMINKDAYVRLNRAFFNANERIKALEAENASLREDSERYHALVAAGVDNWDGYDYAMELLEEANDE